MLEAEAKISVRRIELLEDVKDKHRGAVNLQVLKRINNDLKAILKRSTRSS
jgi:hypothetical protein